LPGHTTVNQSRAIGVTTAIALNNQMAGAALQRAKLTGVTRLMTVVGQATADKRAKRTFCEPRLQNWIRTRPVGNGASPDSIFLLLFCATF
jgi:hypothetical protein